MHCPANDSKRKAVSDDVCHSRPASVRLKAMGMMPELVGSLQLHVYECRSKVVMSYLGKVEMSY